RRATKGDELPLASDEDWAWTELAAGDLRPQADEPERQNRLLLALCEDRFDGFDVDKVPEQPVRRFSQEDLAGRSVLLEARGRVRWVAGQQSLASGHVSGDDLSGVDARPVR